MSKSDHVFLPSKAQIGPKREFSHVFNASLPPQSNSSIIRAEFPMFGVFIDAPPLLLVEFSYNNSYQESIQMAPYEALYGRPCRSPLCWTEVGESSITSPDIIRDTSEKVSLTRQRLLKAQSRQKSYADVRRRPLEFEVGDHVFLKVMPKREVVRFGKRGKLSPRFIGPFKIQERVGTIAYRLVLPPSMSGVHEVFHVSMLRKYTLDPAHVVDWGQIEVDTDGTFEEGPVCILDSHDQVL